VMADQVMYSGIVTITDLIVKEGLINLDLADVKAVLGGMGRAMMGMGEASGEQRAIAAAEEAMVNPLLDEVTLKGAKSLLLCITGGRDMTLWEVEEAASRVCQEVDPDANIIVGATFDDGLGDRIRVSIVASGMPKAAPAEPPRDTDLPVWVPRAQRDLERVSDLGRRLGAALSGEEEGLPEPLPPPRPPRGRARERRPPHAADIRERMAAGAGDMAMEGESRLAKPPPSRSRKGAGPKRVMDGTPRTLDGTQPQRRIPPTLNGAAEGIEPRRRSRRVLHEEPVADDWRDLPAPTRALPPANGEAIYPGEELTAPIVPRREPDLLPARKLGFFERLGFGRGRRGE
jgi:cell division protein FtsZ